MNIQNRIQELLESKGYNYYDEEIDTAGNIFSKYKNNAKKKIEICINEVE